MGNVVSANIGMGLVGTERNHNVSSPVSMGEAYSPRHGANGLWSRFRWERTQEAAPLSWQQSVTHYDIRGMVVAPLECRVILCYM
jgi:hypothetical protein